jgi:hypothetical protein
MRERAITAGVLIGLACFAGAIFAFVSRNTGPCGKPETCHVESGLNSHPYAGYGDALAVIGALVLALAIALAVRRPTAP